MAAPRKQQKQKAKTGPKKARMMPGTPDAIDLLGADHDEVDALFEQYETAPKRDKRALVNAICTALKVHAHIEEQLFYPAAMEATGEVSLLTEAMVEHATARDLIAQLETGFPGEPMFDARVTVLAEYVRHHVDEEETELFPLCRESRMDLAALAQQLAIRKQELLTGLRVSNPVLALS